MTVPAQKFRELVFQMLYSYNIGRSKDEDMVELFSKELYLSKNVVREAQERVHQLLSHLDEIDEQIRKTSRSYEFERIQTVEKNILRLGIFELFYDQSIPMKVAIAEAKRLAKKFSTKESASFIHAVLDAAYRAHLGEKIDPQEIVKSAEELKEIEKIIEEIQLEKKESNENPLNESSDE